MLFLCVVYLITSTAIEIPAFERPPIIDGDADVNEWTGAYVLSGYYTQVDPDFGQPIDDITVVRLGCDMHNVYVLFEVLQDTATLIEKKGTRDNVWAQDAAGIIIDPLGNRQEQYQIILGLSGTIMDGRKVRATTEGDCDWSWDADMTWTSARTDSGFTVEAQIPFSNFRCPAGEDIIWNINLFRKVQYRNSQTLYSPLKEHSSEAEYDALFPVVMRGIRVSERIDVTPYGIYGTKFDAETSQQGDAGFDIKIPLAASGVANIAFNPDFSQLEGDPIDFDFASQYAIYYPEYRSFFIEEKGVFETDWELYYSRTIQNPLVAARYTYKSPSNQGGIIFAYDEEDTTIENADAAAAVCRYTRQIDRGNAGLMLLDRFDLDTDRNSAVVMTDGNIFAPLGVKITYQLAASDMTDDTSDMFADMGLYYHVFTTYITNNWIILGNFWGLSPNYKNDLGYIEENDINYGGGYIARRFYFNNPILKKIEIGENFGFFGTWSEFDDYWRTSRDSLEYFALTDINFNLFTSTFVQLRYRLQKEYWEGVYLDRWAYNLYAESRPTDRTFVSAGFNGGYLIDFNVATVSRFLAGWIRPSYSPVPEININIGGVFNIIDQDTTRQALHPGDVDNPVFAWRTYGIDAGITYNPNNVFSFEFVAEREIARFAPGYGDYEVETTETENRIFAVIQYKPSVGNVIYFGGRYPEKLIFFKFTHRFRL
jgi:hypothetical protein